MSRQEVVANGERLTVNYDGVRPPGKCFRALVVARLVDELTDEPIPTPVEARTELAGARRCVGAGGMAGLAGVPGRVFPANTLVPFENSLKTTNHRFDLTFSSPGYVDWPDTASLGPFPGFPDEFAPDDLGDLPLRREPVYISGIVMRNGGAPASVSGATVEITALWRKLPPADASPAPDPLHPLSLRAPLYADRQQATTKVRRRSLNPLPADDKKLRIGAPKGADTIELGDRVNLNPGDLLAIDVDDPAVTEYLAIAAIDGASNPENAARVSLDWPLAYRHRKDVTVRPVQVAAAGADNDLGVDARAGDSCLFLDTFNDLDPGEVIEVDDGASREFHRYDRFTVDTDGDGFFRFPPLQRVAQIDLRAREGGDATDVDALVPDYPAGRHWLEITL